MGVHTYIMRKRFSDVHFFIVLFYFCVVQPLRKPLRHTASILILSIRAEYKYDLYFETKSMHVCCLQIATLIFL